MKKLIVAVFALSALAVTAQEAPKVTSAIIALRGNELVKPKGLSMKHQLLSRVRTKVKSKKRFCRSSTTTKD